jgi:hypothetical protein
MNYESSSLDVANYDIEYFGAKGDGITDDTVAFQAAMNQTTPVHANGSYIISSNIAPIKGATLYGRGTITQVKDGDFSWGISNRTSSFPMFKITNPNFTISGITLINKFEGISISGNGNNCTIENVKIANPARTLSSAITAFNISDFKVIGGMQAYSGKRAAWDEINNKNIYGTCLGIDFGGCHNVEISHSQQLNNGLSGIFYYGASNVRLIGNYQFSNGQSGIQVGPNPNHSGLMIVGNYAYLNCADGVDINWTGTDVVKLQATLTGMVSIKNGFFYGDTSKPTQDGSGIATMRNVADYTLSDSYSIDCAGVGLYCTKAANAIISGLSINNTITNSSGVYFGEGVTDVIVSDCIVKTAGSALQLGGSQTVSKFTMHDCRFTSSGAAASLPANTYQLCKWHDNYYEGSRTVNMWFGTANEVINYTDSSGEALFLSTSYSSFNNLAVRGVTTGNLARLSGGTGNSFQGCEFINNGVGVGLKSENCSNLTFNKTRVWCATGTGLIISGGNNITANDIDWYGTTCINSNQAIYYSGRPKLTGAQTYSIKPYDAQYIQRA